MISHISKQKLENYRYLICVQILFTDFFSKDLSLLINFLIDTVNSRPDKIATRKKLIESVENLLKQKFTEVKGYLIGSHAYKIPKGGLATVDIHLDLRRLSTFILTLMIMNHC